MALLEIAVDGCTLVDDNTSNTTSLSITSAPSLKVKAENKGAYKGSLDFIIASGSGITGSCVLVNPVNGSISPTAIKTKVENSLVMRKEDSVTVSTNGQNPSTGASCPLVFNIRISDAGQTKVKVE